MNEAKGNPPIACALTADELLSMREGLLPGLVERAVTTELTEDGCRWGFSFVPGLLKEVGAVIDAEHRCCPFLRFVLRVEPGDGLISLEVTGPEGTVEFLSTMLGMI